MSFGSFTTPTLPKSEKSAPPKREEPAKEQPSYAYDEFIKTPPQLGVSSRGTLTALGNDIKAINEYVNVLSSGYSKAQTVSPLGNKYFKDMGSECKDSTGQSQARFAFINNIPDGKFFGKGLVPGILEDISNINPSSMFTAFKGDSTCQKITLSTRDNKNMTGTESRYVLQSDILSYNPCWFPNKRNPVSNEKCEGMQSMQMPNDPILKTYYVGLGALGAFLIYRFMNK